MATWPPVIDDDGTGTTGTPTDYAFFNQIKAYIDDGGSPPVVTIVNGGSNIFDVALPTPRPFYLVNVQAASADITLRSMTVGRVGDSVLIVNNQPMVVWMTFATGGFLGPFYNRISSGPTPIANAGSGWYVSNGVGWVLHQHDQGKLIRVPYSAANFTAGGGGSISIPSGNVAEHEYLVNGNTLAVQIYLSTIGVTGTVTAIRAGGFPFAWKRPGAIVYPGLYHNGTTWQMLTAIPETSPNTAVSFSQATFPNNCYVSFHGSVEIV